MSESTPSSAARPLSPWYLPFLIGIAGLGGLIAGVDYGIIAGALLYVDKTIPMSELQQGIMVSIYIGGGVIASLFAGAVADLLGRKVTMLAGGLMFVLSIILIYLAVGYPSLLAGRILMGLSGGIICIVVPLYMAECLPSHVRGRGTSAFQFLLTLGFVVAAWIAKYFTGIHDAAVAAAAGNAELVFAADDAAWRNMFLVATVPGILFSVGMICIRESPRWLFRRRRVEQARAVLRLSRSEAEADRELAEMAEHAVGAGGAVGGTATTTSLFQRRYIVPFVIACIVLACTQATGINTIISYAPKILLGAGMDYDQAADSNFHINIINCVVTLLAALLVDKAGRKLLLSIGTAGIIVTLAAAGLVYRGFESQRVDVAAKVASAVAPDGRTLTLPVGESTLGALPGGAPGQLSVLYAYDDGRGYHRQEVVSAFSNGKEEKDRTLAIRPKTEKKWVTVDGRKSEETIEKDLGTIRILRAKYGPIPTESTGWWITGLLGTFIAFFAIGPGVCVWLALTELMPTRIRSMGIGVAMSLNTGVQFLSAFLFPIVVGNHGFSSMFFVWASCTVVYFVTAAFFMPETKGKTLEEIEDHFAGKASRKRT